MYETIQVSKGFEFQFINSWAYTKIPSLRLQLHLDLRSDLLLTMPIWPNIPQSVNFSIFNAAIYIFCCFRKLIFAAPFCGCSQLLHFSCFEVENTYQFIHCCKCFVQSLIVSKYTTTTTTTTKKKESASGKLANRNKYDTNLPIIFLSKSS